MVVAPSCSLSLLGTHQQNFGFSNSDAVIDVMVFFEYSLLRAVALSQGVTQA